MIDSRNIVFEGIDLNLKVIHEEADAKRWEELNKKAELLTKETYESWKEELGNLLIFAGLFSAIVTAFTIEAAKTVLGDPAEMTVLLLQTIILQLNNQSNPLANLPINLSPERPPSLYAQRINLLYSVSLALSLVTVLGGILCLQWLREFSRNITGVSNKEDLSIQYQRHESLQAWGVVAVLNMLPLLLLIALGLFFTGFMYSQWESKSLASGPVASLVVISGVVIIGTTILPTCHFLFLIRKSTRANDQTLSQPVLCPYRSPQSWLFHLIFQKLLLITKLLSLNTKSDFLKALEGINSWMDYNINGGKRWKGKAGPVGMINQSLLWISREYRQVATVAGDAYSCMVFASCYRTRMKLKGGDTPANLTWEWEEQNLLSSFETDNEMNDTEIIRKIRAKAAIDAIAEWDRSDVSQKHTAPLSGFFKVLEKSVDNMDDSDNSWMAALMEDIVAGLRSSETTWVTTGNAIAIACHVIDKNPLLFATVIPVLQELSKRPSVQSLSHMRHLCNKLRETLRSEHKCHLLIPIFNRVFSSVDSENYQDIAPILGRLLVECDNDKCLIFCAYAEQFLVIIERLASEHLISKEESLDAIFLYTTHILQHSYGLYLILPSIEKTLNAILSAAKEHVQHESHSEYSVLHPDKFTVPRTISIPGMPEDLELVWSLIDNFNMRLKAVWGIHEEGGEDSEESRKIVEQKRTYEADERNKETTSHAIHSTGTPPTTTLNSINKINEEKIATVTIGGGNLSQDSEPHSRTLPINPPIKENPHCQSLVKTNTLPSSLSSGAVQEIILNACTHQPDGTRNPDLSQSVSNSPNPSQVASPNKDHFIEAS